MTVPTWAPLAPNPFGVWDVEPGWVADHAADVQLLDVREPDEFTGELGHIAGAVLIPLGELAERTGALSKDKPIVAVCRSGVRSAHAVRFLAEAGFERLANLPGGMLRWRQDGRAVETVPFGL